MITPSLDTLLWGLAALWYGVGDTVTTLLGVRHHGIEERNPVVVRLLGAAPRPRSLVALKLVVFALFGAVYSLLGDRPERSAIPAALAVLGAVVTAVNVRVLRRRHPRL